MRLPLRQRDNQWTRNERTNQAVTFGHSRYRIAPEP